MAHEGDEKTVDATSGSKQGLGPFDWWVFSTALRDGVLMLTCKKTGAYGIVRDPTKKEWSDAFFAPSNPYRWQGGHHRVEVQAVDIGWA